MVNLETAKFAGVIMTIGLVGIAGTNLVFAQQPCGEQPYVYNVGCLPLGSAQMAAVALVVGVIALSVGCGIVGARSRLMH
jgi:hypothetical protein